MGSTSQVDLGAIVNYEVAVALANVLPHLAASFDPIAAAVRVGLEAAVADELSVLQNHMLDLPRRCSR